MIAVVASRADEASMHIAEHLRDLLDTTVREDETRSDAEGGGTYYRGDGVELREFEALHLHLEDAAAPFDDPALLVFASRHAGETGPLLTAHFTGNLGPAEFGGREGELARACPNAHALVLDALREHAPEGYDVGTECTHHGPSGIDVPSMFVEVGSAEAQWRDPDAARAAAKAVRDLRGALPDRERTVVGIGGGHYAPRFERIARETDWAVGHVAADWALDAMGEPDPAVLEQVFERSAATRAVIDGEKPALERHVAELGYRVVSETWVRETTGVPLARVAALEERLCGVDEGLRFGERAGDAAAVAVRDPDPELLATANGIDRERVGNIVAEHAVAVETAESGTLVEGRIAVPEGSYDALIDALAALLRERFDAVERTDGELVVRERAFDPAAARERGVPEGPAFGRLADGEAVEGADGTVTPEMVHAERERRFRL